MEILTQLGGLVLGAVPTIVLFVLLVVAYNLLVRRPLVATLSERNARTGGAVEQAKEAIAAAEQKTTLYEDKLRAARLALQSEREKRMAQWNTEREGVLAEARNAARTRIDAARVELESSASAAREQIEEATAMLSDQILRAVLPAGAAGSEAQQ
jgi:F-type H+-transporting ATPase subunit b